MSRRSRRAWLVLGVGLVLLPTLAPATIEEQRARLPPAATNCDDPVAGVWMSHKFEDFQLYWYVFTLRIQRRADYTAIGILNASSVYDGQRLPELYRICDPMTGATIAYVEPNADIPMATMIGTPAALA